MRWFLTILLTLTLSGIARAADDPHRAQIDAATANAVANLLTDIEAEPISPKLSVHQFLEITGSRPQLRTLLTQAQQIGGPRWIDAQTCQVRLEIGGPAITRQLAEIASANSKTSPLRADELQNDLHGWNARIFSATGTSTAKIDALQPPASSLAWKNVSANDVHRAVAAARQSAVRRVLDSIAPVPLAGDKKVGDALAISDVASAMAKWVADQPVTLVNFRDDHRVEMTLSLTAATLSERLRTVLAGRTDIELPMDEKSWAVLADAISHAMDTPVGLGTAAQPATQPGIMLVLDQPPDWADKQLDAQGSAAPTNSKLRSARLAENDALAKLRDQIRALAIAKGTTLGSVADVDPRMEAAIERSLHRSARAYNVDYKADGSVDVRMSIDCRDLWEELSTGR